jgi:hypothetical protein
MNTQVQISKAMAAPLSRVWKELSSIETHVEWMADAVAIDFHSSQRTGVGTTFSCATKIGPFRTTDEMTIDRWEEGRAIGVTHRGAVTGSGVFELSELDEHSTTVVWTERLIFPLWMGSSLGAMIARPFLRWIWRRNLDRLADRVEM